MQGSISSDDMQNFTRVIQKYNWVEDIRSELKKITSLVRYTSNKKELLKMTAIQELKMVNYIPY